MRWINDITWKSEWPKYQLQDTAGHRLPPLCQDQVRHQGQPLLVELEG
jgi:hypothetical protein